MHVDIQSALSKLWVISIASAGILTLIYLLFVDQFDRTYFSLLAILCLGYLPYSLLYRKLTATLQYNILFINICIIFVLLSWYLPFFNHIIIIFLPLIATLYKNKLIFYFTSVISVLLHFSVNFLTLNHNHQHQLVAEGLMELAYIICYLVILGIIVNIVNNSSKRSYMFDKTVRTLILAIETKDMYTHGHSLRVSDYSMIIGEHLKSKGKQVNLEILRISSLLHDIGKIYIPSDIINKTGKLTEEEYSMIQKHSEYGAKLANDLEYPKDVVENILLHHERFDGNGYPQKLKGKDIPLHARIIALADTFDAITSNRSYRDAFTLDQAKQIILDSMGSQFDPEFEETFKEVFPILSDYYEKNSENYSIDSTQKKLTSST